MQLTFMKILYLLKNVSVAFVVILTFVVLYIFAQSEKIDRQL